LLNFDGSGRNGNGQNEENNRNFNSCSPRPPRKWKWHQFFEIDGCNYSKMLALKAPTLQGQSENSFTISKDLNFSRFKIIVSSKFSLIKFGLIFTEFDKLL